MDELGSSVVEGIRVLVDVEVLDIQLAECVVKLGKIVDGVATKSSASRLIGEAANVLSGTWVLPSLMRKMSSIR